MGEGGHEDPRARRTASPRTAPPPDGPQTTGGRAPVPAPHLPTLLPASWRPAHSGLPGEAQSERRRQRGRGRGRGSVGTAATVRLSPAGARGLSGDRASLVLPLPATRGPREADARRACSSPRREAAPSSAGGPTEDKPRTHGGPRVRPGSRSPGPIPQEQKSGARLHPHLHRSPSAGDRRSCRGPTGAPACSPC